MSVPTQVVHVNPATYNADGQTGWYPTATVDYLSADINVTSLRGTSPTLDFYVEREGADGVAYSIWHPTQLTAIGAPSTSIGPGMATTAMVGLRTRLRWVFGGTALATTVTTGANSATQTLGDTTGIVAGDVLHFATANVNRTVLSVTNGTVLVLTASVNSTTSEVVTVNNTPDAIFSASVEGR